MSASCSALCAVPPHDGRRQRRPGTRCARAERARRRADSSTGVRSLNLVQLTGLEKRYPARSFRAARGGSVALAGAMAIEPRYFCSTEPFPVALDAQVRHRVAPLAAGDPWRYRAYNRVRDHDRGGSAGTCRRVVVMNQGRIEQIGTADDVYDTPNSRSSGFIGDSGALAAAGSRRDGQLTAAGPHHQPQRNLIPTRGDRVLYFPPPRHPACSTAAGSCGAGTVVAGRRVAGTRRVELGVGGELYRVVEIELRSSIPLLQGRGSPSGRSGWRAFQ